MVGVILRRNDFCTLLGNFKNSQRGSFGEEKLFFEYEIFVLYY